MIRLQQIRLINWYGFSQITIPVGTFTLIAGKNGNGKSVLLDAVKYALYGDTVFNKSTENKGSRTIPSYTRGLLDATAGSYMRPADAMPNIYTHIVLEFKEPELERSFILGTVIETNSANGFSTQRYVMENKTLAAIEHTYKENGAELVYSGAELQKRYGLKMMQATEGLTKFMQRTGLRLSDQQLAAFRRKLRSIMSYDPDAKIDQFIRESVLEEKKVDFSKLVETKTNIDALTKNFTLIDEEIKELEAIIALFDKLTKARNVIFEDDVKIAYKQYTHYRQAYTEAERNIDVAERQLQNDTEQLNVLTAKEKETRELQNAAQENLNSMDCAKAINEAEKALALAASRRQVLAEQQQALQAFQERVTKLLSWCQQEAVLVSEPDILASLTSASYSSAQKASSVERFLQSIKAKRDELVVELAGLKKAVYDNEAAQAKCQKLIAEFAAKRTTFSDIPDYVALKNEINREFARRNIDSTACFACEYIIGMLDEAWRDTIEGYLGRRRYTILVEPQFYDIADDVLNASKYKYAHLFNTKLLMKKDVKVQDDSVVDFLEVKNPVAKQYFAYQLGRFHAVPIDQVKQYENAMSKEGRVAVAMDSYFIRFDSIRFYCLGQETLELNRRRTEKRLAELQKEALTYHERIAAVKAKQSYLDTETALFGDYNYAAVAEYEAMQLEYAKKAAEVQALKEAQRSNSEFMQLVMRVEELEKENEAIVRLMDKVREDKAAQTGKISINKDKLSQAEVGISSQQSKLQEYEQQNQPLYKQAIADYDNFLANGEAGAGGIRKDRARAERSLREAGENLRGGQAAYNAKRSGLSQLPLGDAAISAYQSRKDKIWLDERQEIQAKLKAQTHRYEDIFKNEFVLTVFKSCEAARSDLKLINAELANLAFKATYEFDVKYVKDGSDYEKILEYARYLKEREELGIKDDQLTFDLMTDYSNDKGAELEQEMKQIINRIVASEERDKIERYADYRNYMTYELLLTNDVLAKAKLSKQSGYNSGAEVQIPYMLILLSALLMIYNDKHSSTRLVFIDEPFAKMDPTNVKIMLKFMREQKLQMIFCAPDKTELIGNECEVILPVLRVRPDLMEIGIIDIHEGAEA